MTFFRTKSTSILALYLSLGLLFFGMGAKVIALDLKVVRDTAGKQTLRDDQGKEVVLELRQLPLSDSHADMFRGIGPRYTVTVYASRSVVFDGSYLVKTIGQASHTLTEQQLEEMKQELQGLKLGRIKSDRVRWWYGTLKVSLDGNVWDIDFAKSNVEQYVQIRTKLEKYLRTMAYRCPVDSSKYGDRTGFDACADLFELPMLLPRGENRGRSD